MLNYSANGPSGYNLTNSLRFRSSASAFLSRTPASASNRTTWTWSGWVKRGQISIVNNGIFSAGTSFGVNNNNLETISFPASDTLEIASEIGGATQYRLITTQLFRDPSSWYHVIVSVDTTQATASNRIKIYINGTQVTAFSTSTYPSQNYNCWTNSTNAHRIGSRASPDFDGYMDEINFIDGQALTPSSFGSTNPVTGVWQPAKYTGTYGTNGFYLNFTDIALTSGSNTGLGRDFSGNGNFWNTNNISVTSGTNYDAMSDVPTLTSATQANYCVWNPLDSTLTSIGSGLREANLLIANQVDLVIRAARATFGITSGKWYWENSWFNTTTTGYIGIGTATTSLSANLGSSSTGYSYNPNGNKFNNGSGTAYGATFTSGDIIGIAFDADNGTLTFYKNGVSQGTAFTGLTSGPYFPMGSVYFGDVWVSTFGQRPFAYTPPTGFVALNTFNLPTSTIVKGNTVMDATLWTGNGSAGTITNAGGFRPDFVWWKNRNGTRNHLLFDSVRGATKFIQSNTTNAEQTDAQSLTSFNSNGFSYGTSGNGSTNGETYVGWQWQAGQGSTSTNTAGSITSTVSVNATAGFSIATFTAPSTNQSFTVGHGLGVAPRMTIVKRRDNSFGASWWVWHIGLGDNTSSYLVLNSSAAVATEPSMWGTVGRTSTLCGFNAPASIITSGTYVLYSWAEIANFSRFGTYTGNGSANGPFVFTGFRPKYIMIKNSGGGATSSLQGWIMIDTSRSPFNQTADALFANNDIASTSNSIYAIDILSNGFKTRGTDGAINESSATYIYMAFAENPFKNSLAR